MFKKWIVASGVFLVIVFLLAFFTNFFKFMPTFVAKSLSRPYWQNLAAANEIDLSGIVLPCLVPVGVLFFVFCYFMIRPTYRRTTRRVVERSGRIYSWLQSWFEIDEQKLPSSAKDGVATVRRLVSKLDRLFSTVDPKIRDLPYMLKLALYYLPYGHYITAYETEEEDIDPPIDDWPIPSECMQTTNPKILVKLLGAFKFASAFTWGALAYVGHSYWTFLWIFLIAAAISCLVGGLVTQLVIYQLRPFGGLILSSLSLSLFLGAIAAWVWAFAATRRVT